MFVSTVSKPVTGLTSPVPENTVTLHHPLLKEMFQVLRCSTHGLKYYFVVSLHPLLQLENSKNREFLPIQTIGAVLQM